MVTSAGWPFVAVAFGIPVLAALATVVVEHLAFLNVVHVASGAIWAGATVFVAGIFGPTLMDLEPAVRGQVNAPLIPKNLFLFGGVGIATLVTGPIVAVRTGMWNLGDPYILVAVAIGVALLAGALYLVRLQVAIYGEIATPGPPDGERVGSLARQIGMVSPVMLLLQVGILIDMALLGVV